MPHQRVSSRQGRQCTRPLAHAIALEAVTPSLSLGTGPCCRSSRQALRLQRPSQAPRVFTGAFFAVRMLSRSLRFGASVSMRHATGRNADAQSGCLSFGSLLNRQQRQSAIRQRQMGRASCGALRTESAAHMSTGMRQNLWNSKCREARGMQGQGINIHRQFGVFSSALASVTRLTQRSSGRQHWPWLRHFHGQCWCPTHLRCSGAAYLGS